MRRNRTHSIVISSSDYGDYDRIVSLLTKDFGKISGIAKGAKKSMKRFGGSLEQGMYVDLSFCEKKSASLVRLEHCDILRPWKSIRAELEKYLIVCQMLELVKELLPDREKSAEVFSLVLHSMTILEETQSVDVHSFLLTFEVKLLRLTGFRPNLEHCVVCKKTLSNLSVSTPVESGLGEGQSVGFSPDKGGCVCAGCRADEPDIGMNTLMGMRKALSMELKNMASFFHSPQESMEGRKLLRQFIEIRVGKKLKAQDVAQSVIRTRGISSS